MKNRIVVVHSDIHIIYYMMCIHMESIFIYKERYQCWFMNKPDENQDAMSETDRSVRLRLFC